MGSVSGGGGGGLRVGSNIAGGSVALCISLSNLTQRGKPQSAYINKTRFEIREISQLSDNVKRVVYSA